MKEITILIPTRNRLGKLLRLLATIPKFPWLRVLVGCDGDHFTAEALCHPLGAPALLGQQERSGVINFYNPDLVLFSRQHVGSMALCNLLSPMANDGLLPLCDDMEILPGAIEKALESFNRHFPDDDGVLGFHQEGIPHYSPGAIFLMGERFLNRYPGRRIFYPGYWHFGDSEVMLLAETLGKFHFEPQAAVYHHHPGIHKDEVDMTHQDARKKRQEDQELALERQNKGEIWGKDEEMDKALTSPPRDRMLKPEEATAR